AAKKQEAEQVIAAKEKYGVTFYKLSKKEMKTLRKQANSVHKKFAPEINKLYKGDTYQNKNYLKKVQKLMKY
ncbi:MAG: C4-dicarboxylate ABC transporter substrate-binding protein, partial [Deltaproteobacteria bacterium]|nr:C4-dicarboxylate ABC transporter substrate-binding protein [Deltaproteobacteria bacterium]